MTKVSESTDTGTSSMDAVTERIPRIVLKTPHPDSPVTAPLPVVRVRSVATSRRDLVRVPPKAANVRRRRTSAPLGLRIFVLMLLFVLLASASGVVAQRMRPKWFSAIEHYIRPESPMVSPQRAQLLDHAVLLSSSPAAVTYAVPAVPYSIVVAVDSACWLVVRSPAQDPKPLTEMTLTAAASPLSVPIRGSSSIMVAARTRAITITEGSRVIGVIPNPHAGTVYSFIPRP